MDGPLHVYGHHWAHAMVTLGFMFESWPPMLCHQCVRAIDLEFEGFYCTMIEQFVN